MAAYIILLDLWYILPAPVTTRLHGHISLHLHRKGWIDGRLGTRFTHLAEGICLEGRTCANRALPYSSLESPIGRVGRPY